jgi:hypothetical protein
MERSTARKCGTCTLCCKLLAVQEIEKPAGVPCVHCDEGQGCQIYKSRPKQCRMFDCYFLGNPKLRENWRPSKSHIVLVADPNGLRLAAHVDPQWPLAWRPEPFYSMLKKWAQEAMVWSDRLGQVLVCVGKQTIVILPDRNVEVGIVEVDEIVVSEGKSGPNGLSIHVFKIKRDDPRASSILGAASTGASHGAIF